MLLQAVVLGTCWHPCSVTPALTFLQGIWLSVAPKISEKLTLVMDLEGNDGRERDDDTVFERQVCASAHAEGANCHGTQQAGQSGERNMNSTSCCCCVQSALFALAVADVLLINIWCHDIGREHGAGKPLLKTIFQVS